MFACFCVSGIKGSEWRKRQAPGFILMLQDQAIVVAMLSFLSVTVQVLYFPSLAAHYVVQCGRLSERLTARLNDTAVPQSEQSAGRKIKCAAVAVGLMYRLNAVNNGQ
jgi:membrane protein implicated in regulation of membrane protease activity